MFDPAGDLSTGERGLVEFLDYVVAQVSGAETDNEGDWIELKSDIDLNTKVGGAKVAKFIIGASNRDPKRAALHLGGRAVFVAGVGSGRVHGTQRYEMRDIAPHIEKLVDSSVRWDVYWSRRDELDVAVVVVEPPDGRLHFAQKSGGEGTGAVVDGQVYIRSHDRTKSAGSGDLERLLVTHAQEVARRPEFDVGVRLLGTPSASEMDVRQLSLWIKRWAVENLPRTAGLAGFGRSVTEADAREWARKVDEAMGDIQRGAFSFRGARMAIEATNRTRRDLADVRVEITVPGEWLLLAPFDKEDFAAIVPDTPQVDYHHALVAATAGNFYLPPDLEVTQKGPRGARRLSVEFERLVPEDTVRSDLFVIALLGDDTLPEEIPLQSRVTARDVDEVLEDTLVMKPRVLVADTEEVLRLIVWATSA